MMVTALSPVIGYDRASEIAHLAIDHDLTLKQAALQQGVSEDLYDRVVVSVNMTRPGTADLAAAS
jgi:fumarate hydratase class II